MVDYSKWDHIEISDDEDDTHPNVDTPSLFKWRHEARIQRAEEKKQEKAKKNAQSKLRKSKLEELKEKIKKLEDSESKDEGTQAQLTGLQKEYASVEKEEKEFEEKEAELERYEKEHPNWDVDTISSDKHNRTIINKPAKKPATSESDDISEYFKANGEAVKKFGMMSKYEESHKYLKANMHLVSEHLGSYLVIWAVDLAVEDKHELKERVAHQAIVAQYIMELARTLKRDPRDCVDAFFVRMKTAEKQYKDAFDDEFKALLGRVDARKLVRLEEARKKVEEEEEAERQARLGPAGLDPLEVLKELPADMQKAFEEQDTPLLMKSFEALEPEERQRVYSRVVGSGLWVPSGGSASEGDDAGDKGDDEEEAFEDAE
eukprot:m.97633 g.97633  ORF g.97633 m.97633 type:complete len:375 (-) comp16718_c0_seq5:341-1465(-)